MASDIGLLAEASVLNISSSVSDNNTELKPVGKERQGR